MTPVFQGRGHGSWIWASFWTSMFTGREHSREHGPWTRLVCTELWTPEFDWQDNDVTREN